MRRIKIAATKGKSDLNLKKVPEELIFIQLIARKYADTSEEAETFYSKGIETAQLFRSKVPEETYHSKVTWIVEQTIKSEKHNGS